MPDFKINVPVNDRSAEVRLITELLDHLLHPDDKRMLRMTAEMKLAELKRMVRD